MTVNFILEPQNNFQIKSDKHFEFEQIVENKINELISPNLYDNNKNGCITVHYDNEFKVINYKFGGFGNVPQMFELTRPVLEIFRNPHHF